MNQQAVINYIGSKTILKFSCMVDGVIEFETVVPKIINEEYYNFRLSVFHSDLMDLLCYSDVAFIADYQETQVFELYQIDSAGNKECLYHKKYQQPK